MSDQSFADIENRFSYHPASTPERIKAHEEVRGLLRVAAHMLDGLVPNGRHKALAMTALEETMHWANAAIACQEDD